MQGFVKGAVLAWNMQGFAGIYIKVMWGNNPRLYQQY